MIYRKIMSLNRDIIKNGTLFKSGLYLFLEFFKRDCIRDRTLFESGLYSRVYGNSISGVTFSKTFLREAVCN